VKLFDGCTALVSRSFASFFEPSGPPGFQGTTGIGCGGFSELVEVEVLEDLLGLMTKFGYILSNPVDGLGFQIAT